MSTPYGPAGLLRRLASPVLSVAFFVLMAAGSLAVVELGWPPTWAVAVPLALFGVNLAAAVLVHPRFRTDLPLLVFHLSLLALAALFAIARLSYFEGRAILNVGSTFEGDFLATEQGPLHRGEAGTLKFASERLTEDLATYGRYRATHNRVRWVDRSGQAGVAEIGDDRPLVLDGYRIYTTSNRGFAPIFLWEPAAGPAGYGSVQLRDMGQGGFTPDGGWQLPGGPEMWAMVAVEAPAVTGEPERKAWRVNLDAERLAHHLVVRIGETRHPMRPGDSIALTEGRLSYVELRAWMGYRISHDPTVPWLIAALAIAVGSLIWFYAKRLLPAREPAMSSASRAGVSFKEVQ